MSQDRSYRQYTLSTTKNGSVFLGLISPTIKLDLNYIFRKLMVLTHHNVNRILSYKSEDYFIDIFSKETWSAVSMIKTNRKSKGTKC